MFEKLSEETIQKIRQLSLQGLNVRDIAAQVGASVGSISKYRISNQEKKRVERPEVTELKKKMYFCPECGHQVFFILDDNSKCYLACIQPQCGWTGYLGKYVLPKNADKNKISINGGENGNS